MCFFDVALWSIFFDLGAILVDFWSQLGLQNSQKIKQKLIKSYIKILIDFLVEFCRVWKGLFGPFGFEVERPRAILYRKIQYF